MENQSASADFIEKGAEKEPKGKSVSSNRLFSRPSPETTGIIDWLTTIDHKKVGFMYGMVGLICLIMGGIQALLIQIQVANPESTFVTAREYTQLFTMHGTTMIFLAVMPLSAAFFNFVIPLQIGTRNVALPRINTLSLWCFIAGVVILNISWFFPGGAPAFGWFEHAPITPNVPNGGTWVNRDFVVIGLLVVGLASLLASINFIATIINMRCPGMTMMRLPVFTWMALFSSFLLVLAFPVIMVALIELIFDRQFGTLFFDHSAEGKAIFSQQPFWIIDHPEVYILILPGMGIVSEILPTFSRKPIWGYGWIIFSGAMIGFLGFSVWSHQMFTAELGTIETSAFSILAMLMAIPIGVMLFNWIATLWGGSIRYTTPMLFAVGFIGMLMIGWFTGIMHSNVTVDAQIHKSYFSIAHFHYFLIGGSIFALLAGFYYWMPKFTGSMMSDKFGKLCFALIFTGFNLTFFPMYYLGLEEMVNRTQAYQTGKGWDDPNMLATIGAFTLGFGILFSAIQIFCSVINRKKTSQLGKDPWDARTLEWTTPSPAPVCNFTRTPIVKARDPHWQDKYGSEDKKVEYETQKPDGILSPDGSWWPLFTGMGIFILGFGLISRNMMFHLPAGGIWEPNFEPCILGAAIVLMSIMFWSIEGSGGHHLLPTPLVNSKDD